LNLIERTNVMQWWLLILLFSKYSIGRPSLWSSGQSSWLQAQRSWVRFPVLPNFLCSSGSETGSTQARKVEWRSTWKTSNGSDLENWD
jgi:hypothetical protein